MSRAERVSQMLKEEVSNIMHNDLKDPRIGFITVTRVELTDDLRYAKIYFSILGTDIEQENTKKAVNNSLGFIRRLVAERMNLRFVPEIVFKQDRSAQYSFEIEEALNKIKELKNEPRKVRRVHKKK
ncbi:MAG: 30S ribosome-binding factor RbfA [Candidatus Omnitrophica bacterium]|nr:30S ribosome-binding factor RbfA [Candidatus Omnitrophota bacterium]MDD5610016.1 30S ribosome-binding factor RbfA [Candidatus Omnitrophota bacterium]